MILYVLEILFVICTSIFMIFFKNISVRIISAILLLSYFIISKIRTTQKRNKIIKEININKKTYINCRENKFTFIIVGLNFIIYSLMGISNIKYSVNNQLFLNGHAEVNNLISRISLFEKVDIFIYVTLIIIGIMFFIEYIMSVALLCEDKVIFHNGQVFEYDQIKEIKYKDSILFNKKKIKLRTENYEEVLIAKSDDFEKIKKVLEENITFC